MGVWNFLFVSVSLYQQKFKSYDTHCKRNNQTMYVHNLVGVSSFTCSLDGE
nr:MAG TPA: hypothetical protein [Caudoviricetes sp.]